MFSLALTVIVAEAPLARFPSPALTLLVPVAGVLMPEGEALQFVIERLEGKLSTTVAPLTALGPSLVTMILYCRSLPATIEVTRSVLEIRRSAVGKTIVVLAIFELFP